MTEKFYTDSPTISDVILFDLVTTDSGGDPADVYEIRNVTIYFIERGREASSQLSVDVEDTAYTSYYKQAKPVASFGDAGTPAWLATDPNGGFLEKQDFDSDDNVQYGVYRLRWEPSLIMEGDYVVCYTWNVLQASVDTSLAVPFAILGDTTATTAMPTHVTQPGKYEKLLDKYTPKLFKSYLSDSDQTPDILDRFNKSVAKGFTTVEDLANQILDLQDANSLKDYLLPYLANLFHIKLRSDDTQLWRRQIKESVGTFKKKGTLAGLTRALAAAGMTVQRYAQLWQVKSSSLYTDAFIITDDDLLTDPPYFYLTYLAMLPIDVDNFEVSIRLEGDDDYTLLTPDYVTLATEGSLTKVTWAGDNLSVNSINLQAGDVLKIIYKTAPVEDQSVEDYIRTLPLFDTRDELDVTYPPKNWNVKVIEESDDLFPTICPTLHPFSDPFVFGKVRTEFPYGENAYNMETYNGSVRDSSSPCDMDKNFTEGCSCCASGKFVLDLEIEDISSEKIEEAADIIEEYKPFHAVVHTLNYSGSINDFILPPEESIEFLISSVIDDNVIVTQMNFNRLIEEGSSDADELKRNMLASTTTVYSGSGTGKNNKVVFYKPGLSFYSMPVNANNSNLLEILSGSSSGRYTVQILSDSFLSINETVSDPINTAETPYRLSNVLLTQASASIYQDDVYNFSDASLDMNTGVTSGWKVVVTGAYAGTYTVDYVNSDNTLFLTSFPATANVTGLNWTLKTPALVTVSSGTAGVVAVTRVGRVECDLCDVMQGDYVEYSGTQYFVRKVVTSSTEKVYINAYTGGDVVGAASINVLRRLAGGTGFLSYYGMTLTGTTPTIDNTIENDQFVDNYAVLIGGNYYKITNISGSDMTLSGHMLSWGLSGTSVSYSIVQFVKTSPVETQDGHSFARLDRRGNDSITFVVDGDEITPAPVAVGDWPFALMNASGPLQDYVGSGEKIQIIIEDLSEK